MTTTGTARGTFDPGTVSDLYQRLTQDDTIRLPNTPKPSGRPPWIS